MIHVLRAEFETGLPPSSFTQRSATPACAPRRRAGNSGVIAPVTDYPEDVFDSVIAVHVRGAFLACKHGLPVMRDGGSLVICSSVAGKRGDPGVSAYITAKHAQVGLMRSVSFQPSSLASGLRTAPAQPTLLSSCTSYRWK